MKQLLFVGGLVVLVGCGRDDSVPGEVTLVVNDQALSVTGLSSGLYQSVGSDSYSYHFGVTTSDQDGESVEMAFSLNFPAEDQADDFNVQVDEHSIPIDMVVSHCGGLGGVHCESDLVGAFAWNGDYEGLARLSTDGILSHLELVFSGTLEPSNTPTTLQLLFDGNLAPEFCSGTEDVCSIAVGPDTTQP